MPASDIDEDAAWSSTNLDLGGYFRIRRALDQRAQGSWAVAVEANSIKPGLTNGVGMVALKIMRRRHLTSAAVYEQFGLEARLLARWYDHASAAQLLTTGFLRDPRPQPFVLTARDVQVGLSVDQFNAALSQQRQQGWLPFIAMTVVPFSHTLYYRITQLYSAMVTEPNALLPLWEALTIIIKALELLEQFHQERFYYIDHKPEHVIWHDQTLRFLDWNGGEWAQVQQRGSYPQGQAQTDLRNFIAYVAYPLIALRQFDGDRIRPRKWPGSGHPPDPKGLSRGEKLRFFDAEQLLDEELKTILSRTFWPEQPYAGAGEMAAALTDYLARWKAPERGLFHRLEAVVQDVAQAQAHLHDAQTRFRTLRRLLDRPENSELPIAQEARRVGRHLQHFANKRMLPNEEEDL